MRITSEHGKLVDEQGFVLVPDFLTEEELRASRDEVGRIFPTAEEACINPERYQDLHTVATFPFASSALNQVTVHPEIIKYLERSYGTSRLRLGESTLQAKYGTRFAAGVDQRLHNDTWGKKSLAYPRDDGIFRQTFMILYYSDVTLDLAPTYVVSQEHTRGRDLLEPNGDTTKDPSVHADLYGAEQPVLAKAGSLLIFTGMTLHRGSAMRADVGARFAHFITYHAAESTWMESVSWPSGARPKPDSLAMQRFLEEASPGERELIGFPAVDSPYWNKETLRGMAMRYPGMDLTPYVSAASAGVQSAPFGTAGGR